jgi:hypothetical protein
MRPFIQEVFDKVPVVKNGCILHSSAAPTELGTLEIHSAALVKILDDQPWTIF